MPNPRPYSISEFDLRSQLAEVRRELQLRRQVYPKWIVRGLMTQDEGARRTVAMEAVAETLRALVAREADTNQPRLL